MNSLELCEAIENFLEEKKASDVIRIPLKDRALIGDYFIIASGSSGRQLSAMADFLREKFKRQGKVRLNGVGGPWVIVDLGSIVVHLMLPETRDLYQLEDLWQAHHQNMQGHSHFSEQADTL